MLSGEHLRRWMLLVLFILPATAFARPGPVLFDQGHGQLFVIEKEGPLELSGLARLLSDGGLQVRSTTDPLTEDTLRGAGGVIISGAFLPLVERELFALLAFVEQGGRLAVMLHIGSPLLPLLHRLGVDVATGVLRQPVNNIGGNPLDFLVDELSPHPLTAGVERVAFFGTWPLREFGPRVRSVVRSDASSWVDLDGDGSLGEADVEQSFALVVSGRIGRGEFIVFGDDAVFQNRFLHRYNAAVGRNLAHWFNGGD